MVETDFLGNMYDKFPYLVLLASSCVGILVMLENEVVGMGESSVCSMLDSRCG